MKVKEPKRQERVELIGTKGVGLVFQVGNRPGRRQYLERSRDGSEQLETARREAIQGKRGNACVCGSRGPRVEGGQVGLQVLETGVAICDVLPQRRLDGLCLAVRTRW